MKNLWTAPNVIVLTGSGIIHEDTSGFIIQSIGDCELELPDGTVITIDQAGEILK